MRPDLPELLFHEYHIRDVLEGNLREAKEYIDYLPEKDFLNADDENIVEHVYSKFEVMSLELQEDAMEQEIQETQIDVSQDQMRFIRDRSRPYPIAGGKVTVTIPYIGDSTLWKCRPEEFNLNPPLANIYKGRGNAEAGHIKIVFKVPSDSIDNERTKIKEELDDILSNIRWYLEKIKANVETHHKNLRPHIEKCITERRKRLGKYDELAKALDIPLKKKPGAPDISSLPIKRRIVKSLPSEPNEPPEPGIRNEDYEHILNVIRHEGRSFEATPGTFSKHDEEELRDIVLAHLNGHYQGDATGETFRKHGKTDIRIEDQNRAAFVGEGKVWTGPKALKNAVDQLLGYLTWRDCKAALIIFNKTVAGFTGIQEKVPEILIKHERFIRKETVKQHGEWRFRFRSADDDDRQIIVHIFLFDLYVNPNNKSDHSK